MKPRILIAIHYMMIGGAERSLLGLLNAIDPNQADVDLFIYDHRGEFMTLIPGKVNLLPEIPIYATIEKPMLQMLRKGYIGIVAARLLARLAFKRWDRKNKPKGGDGVLQYISDFTTPLLPSLKRRFGHYDLAVSFVTPHRIVLDKIDAERKVAWIHTDYSTVTVNARRELKTWGQYDYIASISNEVTRAFLTTFPSLEHKIVLIENILSPTFVRQQATLYDPTTLMPRREGEWTLLSVGRFTYPKNFDNLPWICKHLCQMGLQVKWYIVGYGNINAITRNINEAGMENHVIILGKQTNPYPLMARCDVYVQPSRYEGKSVTVREAQMLCKPVVITNYPTAPSQIQNGVDGVIVPLDNLECAQGIARVLQDQNLRTQLSQYLATHDYGNEAEVQKLYQLAAPNNHH